MSERTDDPSTATLAPTQLVLPLAIELAVTEGPDAGKALGLGAGAFLVGKSSQCDLTLDDPGVSRRHLEVTLHASALRVRDLGSRNGSFFQGARFDCVDVGVGATIRVGSTTLRVQVPADDEPLSDHFGELRGHGRAMQDVFRLLRRAARSTMPVLIQGETGTGKEVAARAIHEASARGGALVVCDLAAMSPTLIDSELFGHARGAFTGADAERAGAFEQADGGTLFLDELGELDVSLQPRLLRALETGQVKRVGENHYRKVDVRIIAATNRDLQSDVAAQAFRSDLYHRLAVFCVTLPPLRERRDDIGLLVEHFMSRAAPTATVTMAPDALAALVRHDWPGNLRQLRNVVERAMALSGGRTISAELFGLEEEVPGASPAGGGANDVLLPFKAAKGRLVEAWEHDYLKELMTRCEGNVSLAARRAGVNRVHLHRLLRKHGWDAE